MLTAMRVVAVVLTWLIAGCGSSQIAFRGTYRVPGPAIGPGIPLFPTVLQTVRQHNTVTDQDPRVGELIALPRTQPRRNAAFVIDVHEYGARGIKHEAGLRADLAVTIGLVVDRRRIAPAEAPAELRQEAQRLLETIRAAMAPDQAPMM